MRHSILPLCLVSVANVCLAASAGAQGEPEGPSQVDAPQVEEPLGPLGPASTEPAPISHEQAPVSPAPRTLGVSRATARPPEPLPLGEARPASLSSATGSIEARSAPEPRGSKGSSSQGESPVQGGAPQEFKGFRVSSEDGAHSLKLGGLVQADGRLFLVEGTDVFVIRRARLDVRAKVGKFFGFRLQPELAGAAPSLLDAYASVAFLDEVVLQMGKMKSPLGLELLQSPRDFVFPELGLPSLLVPNRDVGALLQGDLWGEVLSYAIGIFNGVPDGASGDTDEIDAKDVEGRLFLRPFVKTTSELLRGFGAGVAGSYGKQLGALPSHRTPGRATFFTYGDTAEAEGPRSRISPQAYYYAGSCGVLAEYVRTVETITDGTGRTEIESSAWQVVGSFVVGGKAGYQGARVGNPVDPAHGAWGALEVGARYGEIELDRRVFTGGFSERATSARSARNLGAVLSWWFLNGTRALVAFDRTAFRGGAVDGNREAENVVVGRLQVAF